MTTSSSTSSTPAATSTEQSDDFPVKIGRVTTVSRAANSANGGNAPTAPAPAAPAPASVTVPASSSTGGAVSYVHIEETGKGFRSKVCVVPGTTQADMNEAMAIALRTIAALVNVLPNKERDAGVAENLARDVLSGADPLTGEIVGGIDG